MNQFTIYILIQIFKLMAQSWGVSSVLETISVSTLCH